MYRSWMTPLIAALATVCTLLVVAQQPTGPTRPPQPDFSKCYEAFDNCTYKVTMYQNVGRPVKLRSTSPCMWGLYWCVKGILTANLNQPVFGKK